MATKDTTATKAAKTATPTVEPVKNLPQRLLAVMGDLSKLTKDGNNTSQKYKFISHEQVTNELRPLFVKHGIFILPSVIGHTITPYETKNGARMNLAVTKMQYTIINVDDPTEVLVSQWVGEGSDSGDKGTNKSVTAAGKYYLMKMFNIAEDTDPDADAPELGQPMQQAGAPAWAGAFGAAPAPQQYAPQPTYQPPQPQQYAPQPAASVQPPTDTPPTAPTEPVVEDGTPIDVKQKTYMSKLLVDKGFTDPMTRLSIVAGITGNSNANKDYNIDALTHAQADYVINFIKQNDHADLLPYFTNSVLAD